MLHCRIHESRRIRKRCDGVLESDDQCFGDHALLVCRKRCAIAAKRKLTPDHRDDDEGDVQCASHARARSRKIGGVDSIATCSLPD